MTGQYGLLVSHDRETVVETLTTPELIVESNEREVIAEIAVGPSGPAGQPGQPGQSGSEASLSVDPGNAARAGTDGGIYVQAEEETDFLAIFILGRN